MSDLSNDVRELIDAIDIVYSEQSSDWKIGRVQGALVEAFSKNLSYEDAIKAGAALKVYADELMRSISEKS